MGSPSSALKGIAQCHGSRHRRNSVIAGSFSPMSSQTDSIFSALTLRNDSYFNNQSLGLFVRRVSCALLGLAKTLESVGSAAVDAIQEIRKCLYLQHFHRGLRERPTVPKTRLYIECPNCHMQYMMKDFGLTYSNGAYIENVAGEAEWQRLICPCQPRVPHRFKLKETARLRVLGENETEQTHYQLKAVRFPRVAEASS